MDFGALALLTALMVAGDQTVKNVEDDPEFKAEMDPGMAMHHQFCLTASRVMEPMIRTFEQILSNAAEEDSQNGQAEPEHATRH